MIKKTGQLLKKARKEIGLTQAEAGKIINVKRTVMVKIESDERCLKVEELEALAIAYGKPIGYFVGEIIEDVSFADKFIHAYPDIEEKPIYEYILQLETIAQKYVELETTLNYSLPPQYPSKYYFDYKSPIQTTAEAIANRERERLGLGDAPLFRLEQILEMNVGIKIIYLELPREYLYLYVNNHQLGTFIGINDNYAIVAKRLFLARSYCHFLIEREQAKFSCLDEPEKISKSEPITKAFANCLLMPTSSIWRLYYQIQQSLPDKRLSPFHLIMMSRYFGVPLSALVQRLEELKLLSKNTWSKIDNDDIWRDSVNNYFTLINGNKPHNLDPYAFEAKLKVQKELNSLLSDLF